MTNKLATIAVTTLMLSGFVNSMETPQQNSEQNLTQVQGHEKNREELLKFLATPESEDFAQAMETLFAPKNRVNSDIVNELLKIKGPTLPQKVLLSICKLISVKDYKKIKFDDEEVFNIFTQAYEAYPECGSFIYGYAWCFDYGIGTEKNPQKAIELYEKAIDLGHSGAVLKLAIMYQIGAEGVKKDIQKAIELYEKAIELDDSKAMLQLAIIYRFGLEGIEKNKQKAIDLYGEAIKLGNSGAMHDFASLYRHGEGVKKNMQTAIEWYEKALKLGNLDAITSLANIYADGPEGVEKDMPKAIQLYEKAIELRHQLSRTMLIQQYKKGKQMKEIFQVEFKYTLLFKDFSPSFGMILKAKNEKIIEEMISGCKEIWYENFNAVPGEDAKKFTDFKIQRADTNKFCLFERMLRVLIKEIAKHLDNASFFSFCLASGGTFNALVPEGIKIGIIMKEKLRWVSFMKKLKEAKLQDVLAFPLVSSILWNQMPASKKENLPEEKSPENRKRKRVD